VVYWASGKYSISLCEVHFCREMEGIILTDVLKSYWEMSEYISQDYLIMSYFIT
jgi:hypothetical protein